MKKLSSVLALAVLLGFGSSVLADEKDASTDANQNQTATSKEENKDKTSAPAEKGSDAKEENHSDED